MMCVNVSQCTHDPSPMQGALIHIDLATRCVNELCTYEYNTPDVLWTAYVADVSYVAGGH